MAANAKRDARDCSTCFSPEKEIAEKITQAFPKKLSLSLVLSSATRVMSVHALFFPLLFSEQRGLFVSLFVPTAVAASAFVSKRGGKAVGGRRRSPEHRSRQRTDEAAARCASSSTSSPPPRTPSSSPPVKTRIISAQNLALVLLCKIAKE